MIQLDNHGMLHNSILTVTQNTDTTKFQTSSCRRRWRKLLKIQASTFHDNIQSSGKKTVKLRQAEKHFYKSTQEKLNAHLSTFSKKHHNLQLCWTQSSLITKSKGLIWIIIYFLNDDKVWETPSWGHWGNTNIAEAFHCASLQPQSAKVQLLI